MTKSTSLFKQLGLASFLTIFAVGAASVNLAVAQEAVAPSVNAEMTKEGWGKKARGFRGLDLTEDQRAQLKSLNEAGAPERREQAKQARELRKALRNAISEQRPESEIAEIANKIGALESAKLLRFARSELHLLSILTDEQKAQYVAHKAKHQHKRGFHQHSPQGFKKHMHTKHRDGAEIIR